MDLLHPNSGLRRIVTLCGSTRFYPAFQRANYELTMQGHIVLSVGFYPHDGIQHHGETTGCTPEQKQALDMLHFDKILMSHSILVLNINGYIGESTRNEIAWAWKLGKTVEFLQFMPNGEHGSLSAIEWIDLHADDLAARFSAIVERMRAAAAKILDLHRRAEDSE